MADWKNVEIHKNQVQYNTGRAVLIKCPNNSQYAGYCFWHPAKLVRQAYGNRSKLSIGYTDDFQFHLIKKGQGRYNFKDTIAEADIDAEEFEQMYK